MRTSRISRDAARIASSLAASRARTRAAATAPSQAASAAVPDAALFTKEAPSDSEAAPDDSDSSFSSGLSSPPDDSDFEPAPTTPNKKRKRGGAVPTTTIIKQETQETTLTEITSPKNSAARAKKASRAPARKKVATNGAIKVEPPPNWEEIYALTRQMRNENVAPVDTMGCAYLADKQVSPRDQRFQTLISLMLSSQTKDTVTSAAIKGMQENMPGSLNLESVLAIEPAELNAFICKVGFHNLKTKYIKAAAEILRDKWNSDIPDTIEGLVSLPGVGPKMAYLCMSSAWGRDEGIGVDVHVHRITNLWGWHKTKQPEETRAALESWLPKDRWHDINNLLVGFGQTICLPVGRKCGECKLADRGLCPSAVVGKTKKVKEEATVVKTEGPDEEATVMEKVTTVQAGDVVADGIKSEVLDIEDIGQTPRSRPTRRASRRTQ